MSGEEAILGTVHDGNLGVFQDFSEAHPRLLAVRCEPLRTGVNDIAARVAIIDSPQILREYNRRTDQQELIGLVWGALMAMHESCPIPRGYTQEFDIWTSGSPRSHGRLALQHIVEIDQTTPLQSHGPHPSMERLIDLQTHAPLAAN
jgi:hypothetical protein